MRTFGLALLCFSVWTGCSSKSQNPYSNAKVTGRASDPPLALQIGWSPSNRYYYRVETTLCNDMPSRTKGRPVLQESVVALEYALQLARTNSDGSRVISLEILAALFDLTRDGELLVSFDTDNHAFMLDDSNISEALLKLKGARLSCTLSPSNTVTAVQGVSALVSRIGASRPTNMRPLTFIRSYGMIRSLFTEQFFRQLVDWNFLPPEPIRVGHRWQTRRNFATNPLDGGGTAMADLTCTFKGWQERNEQKCARLEFEGKTKGARRSTRGFLGMFPSSTPSELTGCVWFREDGVPAGCLSSHESSFTYSSTRKKPAPNPADTNSVTLTNAPGPTYSLSTRQHTLIELLEVGPLPQ